MLEIQKQGPQKEAPHPAVETRRDFDLILLCFRLNFQLQRIELQEKIFVKSIKRFRMLSCAN